MKKPSDRKWPVELIGVGSAIAIAGLISQDIEIMWVTSFVAAILYIVGMTAIFVSEVDDISFSAVEERQQSLSQKIALLAYEREQLKEKNERLERLLEEQALKKENPTC